ncbi:rhomboid family intramembrane serine protease [bacterium]|nr:rhomboid family intramembrane serine protease [bacterium]
MIALTCPTCAERFRVADEAAGRPVECPACGGTVTASGADATPHARLLRQTARTLAVACPCGERFGVPRSRSGKDVVCPECHRTLRVVEVAELAEAGSSGTLTHRSPTSVKDASGQFVAPPEPSSGGDGLRLAGDPRRPAPKPASRPARAKAPAVPCPSCGEPLAPTATLCVACGTHLKTGRRGLTKVRVGVAEETEAVRQWVEGVSLILWLAIVPYRSATQEGKSRWCNTILVSMTVVTSLVALVMLLGEDVRPLRFALWSGESFASEQLVTHLFLHGGLAHLVGNMIFLWAFGSAINRAVGEWRFPFLYFALGALAGYCGHVLPAAAAADIPLVGASGAISALSGVYLVLFPRHDIHMAAWFRLAWWTRPRIRTFPLTGIYVVLFYTAFDVAAVTLGWTGNVAHWVHLAGFAGGVVMGLVLLLTRVVPSEGYDLLTWIAGSRWQRSRAGE